MKRCVLVQSTNLQGQNRSDRKERAGAMNQLNQMKQCEGEASEASLERVKSDSPSPARAASQQKRREKDCKSRSPKVGQLNRKASLMGAQLADADEELFLRRQSSLSSMFSEKMRAQPVEKRGSADQSTGSSSPQNHSGVMHSPSPSKRNPNSESTLGGVSSPGSRNPSELSSRSDGQTESPGSARFPSGNLYSCASTPNSTGLLNVAHFTFDGSTTQAPENNNLTERLFKKLLGQSRLHRSSDSEGNTAMTTTLDSTKSPSFRLEKSKRKSLRSRVEDANTEAAANPRSKSQLAQYLRSITASSLATDDDNLEGPSEVAWLEPDSPYQSDRSYASSPKKNESWSSTGGTWNLSLNPLRTVSTIVSRRHKQPNARRKLSRFGESKGDAITRISLTGSYDGSYSARSRSGAVRKGSELSSGRSWWSEIGSGRKSSSIWTCSGRTESSAEPDLHEPDMAQANAAKHRQVEGLRANDTPEIAFSFTKSIASSFVFQGTSETSHCSTPDAASSVVSRATTDLHKAASVMDSENQYDIDLDPWGRGSISGSEASLHWDVISKHSFDYVREVAVGSSGLSSRALSRLLLMERPQMEMRDGRFSVDLQRGQKLDKVLYTRTPDVKLRIFAAETKSSLKRSILSPCLTFLQRSPCNNNPDATQRAPTAPSRRKLQVMNNFIARLGPVSEPRSLAGPIYVQ